jgi:Trk K+ transport system NAD-binding subunit
VQAKVLLRNGADEVINPEKQIAQWAAIRYASDHIDGMIAVQLYVIQYVIRYASDHILYYI